MYKYLFISMTFACLFLSGCATKPAPKVITLPVAPMSTPVVDETIQQPKDAADDVDSLEISESAANAPQREEFTFETIYFDYDSILLSAAAKASLVKTAQIFLQHPELKATVAGHCDDRGAEMYNIALGEKRALSIKNYLTNLGVEVERLEIVSYGEENPAVIGFDESSRALNRRGAFM